MEKVEVGGKEYTVIKTGREQAEQVVQFTRWLSMYGPGLIEGLDANNLEGQSGMVMITSVLGNLTSDALIDLFQVLVGCSKKDAEKYFDVGILVDTALEVYENQPGIRRLLDRFFSTEDSPESTEEPSTSSEESTDTPTEKS
jgi:hypothetical protein